MFKLMCKTITIKLGKLHYRAKSSSKNSGSLWKNIQIYWLHARFRSWTSCVFNCHIQDLNFKTIRWKDGSAII